jgi:putative sigma-54 modulation protein
MQVHYTERHVAINDAEKERAAVRFEKIHHYLAANKDLEAHVIFSKDGPNVEAEVTLHALHHTLVVTDTNHNAFTALNHALAKLEKQAHKNKDKLIENRRRKRQKELSPPPLKALAPEPVIPDPNAPIQVVSTGKVVSKPLTLEEAQIVLDQKNRDQVTYRDVESGLICVLLRRRDGRLELVEAPA